MPRPPMPRPPRRPVTDAAATDVVTGAAVTDEVTDELTDEGTGTDVTAVEARGTAPVTLSQPAAAG